MARKRSDRPRNGDILKLFTFTWTVARPITREDGEELVRIGSAVRAYEGVSEEGVLGKHVGYQLREMTAQAPTKPSSPMMTRRETELIVGQAFVFGGSRTMCLSEDDKVARAVKLMKQRQRFVLEEDAVEQAVNKFAAFVPRKMSSVRSAV